MPGPDATDKPLDAFQQPLEELVARVRRAHKVVEAAWANALARALDAGDVLLELQEEFRNCRVSTPWRRLLEEQCSVPWSTAKFYMRLARHREKIEAKMALFPELSLRAARRLIAEPAKKESKPKPDLMVAWRKATAEELTRHFDAVTVVGLLRVISLAFRRELEGRLRKEKAEDAAEPHYKLTMVLRTALGCVKIADDPKTSRAVALSQETAALNALRGLARMHADFHGLSVGFREVKDPKRDPKGDQKRRRAA
jgi:hypothetical protein